MIKYLEHQEDLDNLVKEGKVLVDFYADWCGPCRMLGEVLEQLENIDIIKINCDTFNELALKNGVLSIPAVFLYEDGKIINKHVGYMNQSELEEFIK